MTLDEWRAEVNRLVTETFGIGRRVWRCVQHGCSFGSWKQEQPEISPKAMENGWAVETRLVPLDFCGSLDAVRQVEDAVGFTRPTTEADLRARMLYLEHLKTLSGGALDCALRAHFATAEQRALALLHWKGVAVPERPAGEQE